MTLQLRIREKLAEAKALGDTAEVEHFKRLLDALPTEAQGHSPTQSRQKPITKSTHWIVKHPGPGGSSTHGTGSSQQEHAGGRGRRSSSSGPPRFYVVESELGYILVDRSTGAELGVSTRSESLQSEADQLNEAHQSSERYHVITTIPGEYRVYDSATERSVRPGLSGPLRYQAPLLLTEDPSAEVSEMNASAINVGDVVEDRRYRDPRSEGGYPLAMVERLVVAAGATQAHVRPISPDGTLEGTPAIGSSIIAEVNLARVPGGVQGSFSLPPESIEAKLAATNSLIERSEVLRRELILQSRTQQSDQPLLTSAEIFQGSSDDGLLRRGQSVLLNGEMLKVVREPSSSAIPVGELRELNRIEGPHGTLERYTLAEEDGHFWAMDILDREPGRRLGGYHREHSEELVLKMNKEFTSESLYLLQDRQNYEYKWALPDEVEPAWFVRYSTLSGQPPSISRPFATREEAAQLLDRSSSESTYTRTSPSVSSELVEEYASTLSSLDGIMGSTVGARRDFFRSLREHDPVAYTQIMDSLSNVPSNLPLAYNTRLDEATGLIGASESQQAISSLANAHHNLYSASVEGVREAWDFVESTEDFTTPQAMAASMSVIQAHGGDPGLMFDIPIDDPSWFEMDQSGLDDLNQTISDIGDVRETFENIRDAYDYFDSEHPFFTSDALQRVADETVDLMDNLEEYRSELEYRIPEIEEQVELLEREAAGEGYFDDYGEFQESFLVGNGKMNPEEFAQSAFAFSDGVFNTSVSVSTSYGETRFEGDIYSEETGDRAGSFTFVMSGDPTSIDGSHMELNEEYQGNDFAFSFLDEMFPTLVDAGIEEVTVGANITVGGYAWAKAGLMWNGPPPNSTLEMIRSAANLEYLAPDQIEGQLDITGEPYSYKRQVDFTESFLKEFGDVIYLRAQTILEPDEVKELATKMFSPGTVAHAKQMVKRMDEYNYRNSGVNNDQFPSAQEIAFWGASSGSVPFGDHDYHPGKVALLGTSWSGRYDLTQGNPFTVIRQWHAAKKKAGES